MCFKFTLHGIWFSGRVKRYDLHIDTDRCSCRHWRQVKSWQPTEPKLTAPDTAMTIARKKDRQTQTKLKSNREFDFHSQLKYIFFCFSLSLCSPVFCRPLGSSWSKATTINSEERKTNSNFNITNNKWRTQGPSECVFPAVPLWHFSHFLIRRRRRRPSTVGCQTVFILFACVSVVPLGVFTFVSYFSPYFPFASLASRNIWIPSINKLRLNNKSARNLIRKYCLKIENSD